MIGNPDNPTRERFAQAQREVEAKEREVGSPPRDPRIESGPAGYDPYLIDWQDEEGPTS